MFKKSILCCLIFLLLNSCEFVKPEIGENNRLYVERLLANGDSCMELKQSLLNYSQAMQYYDSAYNVAINYKANDIMIGVCQRIGEIYDTWNQEPKTTIYYYKQALEYAKHPKTFEDSTDYLMITMFLTNAYLKDNDSSAVINTTNTCLNFISFYSNKKLGNKIKSNLLWAVTSQKNYDLTEKLIREIEYESLKNEGINFKSNYVISKINYDVDYLKNYNTAWIDTLKQISTAIHNKQDSINNFIYLKEIYSKTNQLDSAHKYNNLLVQVNRNFDKPDEATNYKLVMSNFKAKETIREKNRMSSMFNKSMWLLIVVFALLLFVAVLFYKNKKKNNELKKINKKLELNVLQNQLLVKEMHHRIKNNLSMVQGLLEMQERLLPKKSLIDPIKAARLRIESIAATHEQLYKNSNEKIVLKDYIDSLLYKLKSQFENKISINIEIDDNIKIKSESCLTIAMLINEMFVNTIKHATVLDDLLKVSIKATLQNDIVDFYFADNGTVNNHNIVKTKGLGLKIMQLFAKQINANLNNNYNGKAYHFHLRFSI